MSNEKRDDDRRLAQVSARTRLAFATATPIADILQTSRSFEELDAPVADLLAHPERTLRLPRLNPNEVGVERFTAIGLGTAAAKHIVAGGPYFSLRELQTASGLSTAILKELIQLEPLSLIDKRANAEIPLMPVFGAYLVGSAEQSAFEDSGSLGPEQMAAAGFRVTRASDRGFAFHEVRAAEWEGSGECAPHRLKAALPNGHVHPILRDALGFERRLRPGLFDIWFERDTTAAKRTSVLEELGVTLQFERAKIGLCQVRLAPVSTSEDLMRSLLATVRRATDLEEVAFAEPAYGEPPAAPEPDGVAQGVSFENAGRFWNQERIALDEAHALANQARKRKAGKPATVVMVDSGLKLDHPDLDSLLHPEWQSLDLNFELNVPEDATSPVATGLSHGTKVAGVVASIAPTARLLPIKIAGAFDPVCYSLRAAAIYEATEELVARNERGVLNLSWRTAHEHLGIREAIVDAVAQGIPVVCSAGNYTRHDVQVANRAHFPSGYCEQLAAVVSVASVASDDSRADHSFFGDTSVTVAAPGGELGGDGIGIYTTSTSMPYVHTSGTSFAAPHVSALLALLFELEPTITPQRAVEIVRSSADSVDEENPLYTGLLGAGRINAAAALRVLLGSDAGEPILPATPTDAPAAPTKPRLLPINTASAADIVTSELFGEWQASAIVAYRTAHGSFASSWSLLATHAVFPWQLQSLEGRLQF